MADKSKSYGDKDIATNLLVTLKHMKAELNTFTQEASNDELFTKIDEVYTCVSTLQRDVFNMMTAQGWYKMTAESAKNISKAYTKFSKSETAQGWYKMTAESAKNISKAYTKFSKSESELS